MALVELEEFFSGVRGQKCWSVIGGGGSGSVISLRFGKKIRSVRPLRNPTLTEEERLFEGERTLLVYCDWRLQSADRIISTSQNVVGDEIDLGAIQEIKNKVVSHIGFTSPTHDLRLDFESDLSLMIFCDLATGNEQDSNFVMFNVDSAVAVTPRGELVIEKRI